MLFNVGGKSLKMGSEIFLWKKLEAISFYEIMISSCDVGKESGKAQSTTPRAQSTKHKAQITNHKAQGLFSTGVRYSGRRLRRPDLLVHYTHVASRPLFRSEAPPLLPIICFLLSSLTPSLKAWHLFICFVRKETGPDHRAYILLFIKSQRLQ